MSVSKYAESSRILSMKISILLKKKKNNTENSPQKNTLK